MLAYRPLLLEMTGQGTFQPALLEEVAVLARVLRRAGLEGAGLAAALRWVPQTVLGAIVLDQRRPPGLDGAPSRSGRHPRARWPRSTTHDRAQYDDVLPFFTSPDLADLFEYSIDRLVDGVRGAATEHVNRSGPHDRPGHDRGGTNDDRSPRARP